MNGVNKAIIVGNVGNDPEIRHTASGDAVANLTIATSEQWKDKNTGEKQERVEWHRVVAFKRLAEIIEQYVKKGSKLYVEGKLQTRSWDQDGVKRYTTEIVANEMQMLDGRQSGDQTGKKTGTSNAPRTQKGTDGSQNGSDKTQGGLDSWEDSSIPF